MDLINFILNEALIFKYIDEYDVFEYYLGEDLELGELVSSPLREDTSPSFNLFKHYSGKIYWKDFAYGYGDCIKLIEELFNIDRVYAIEKLCNDFDLVNTDFNLDKLSNNRIKKIKKDKKICKISISSKPTFSKEGLEYWNRWDIGDLNLLSKYNVTEVKSVKYNEDMEWIKVKELMFAYRICDRYKLLNTESIKYKWINDYLSNYIEGYLQLNDTSDLLIITKALKECIFYRKYNINAVSAKSESELINDKMINHLKTRFNKIIVATDNDKQGRLIADKYNNIYGFDTYFYSAKNITDLYEINKELAIFELYEIVKLQQQYEQVSSTSLLPF